MAHVAITIEGGLVSSDLLERIAATPEAVEGQRPSDFGVEGRLSEEIQGAFSDAGAYWTAFQTRLHRAKESATTITRETWVLPLLEELGYDLRFQRSALQAGGNAYPISHRHGDSESAPPVHIVASDQELDRRGAARQSPHAIVQDYLNRSDALWGIVTNGKHLRLLRDTARFSKPSYIEFDLQGMLEGGLYSEFVLFYRLVHASRLPRDASDASESLLERYHQQGIEEGGRVRKKLRDGVKEALEILGTGFLAHPDSAAFRDKFTAKRLTDIEYYRQLLRLIYRLLFLMVGEERRLLFVPSREDASRQEIYTRWYSIARLRERSDARLFDDGESDLWQGLKQTFRLFEDSKTASELGLTALDGELFGRFACADLIDTGDAPSARLLNDKLLLAIWYLSTFEDADGKKKRGPRRRVNFAGLDVEELGSVYEALLDYHPKVTLDGERSRFDLVAGSERKSTGSYYTPPELVRELIKSALEPVIDDRLAKANTKQEKERALLSLKVCDPASGSGHFLLAAARRIGRELACVRSGESEPNPEEYRRAVRDVIRRCIYAVDKNPLAVDLCKVAFWIEGHAGGLPLSFLDNHVKNGESLVGVLDLAVLEAGVPDGAYTAVTGDNATVASAIKKQNKAEAKEASLFRRNVTDDINRISGSFAAVADLPETTPDEVHTKEQRYAELRRSRDWEKAKAACDLWSAAFFAPLIEGGKSAVPTTRNVWDVIAGHHPQGRVAGLAMTLSHEQRFFHWPLEFPEVFAQGGFDVMLGNPPWERIKLQAKEFFAARDSEIANAPNKAARERLIKALYADHASPDKRALGREWDKAQHMAECEGVFVRESGRYPLTATGDINTYAIFSETFLRLVARNGRAGFIVQSNIFTDDTTKAFFQEVIQSRLVVSFFDMVNLEGIFPGIHRTNPHFCLLTLSGSATPLLPEFAFYLTRTEHLGDGRRRFTLSPDEIALLNPNTRTAPIFRSQSDVKLTARIHSQVPHLVRDGEGTAVNPWSFSYMTKMFDMADSSSAFLTIKDLENAGLTREKNQWANPSGARWVPLYEAKMIHQFDHRWATYEGANSRDTTCEEKSDPEFEPAPRYWLPNETVQERLTGKGWSHEWLMGWRDITNATNERTLIAAAYPAFGVGHTIRNLFVVDQPKYALMFLSNLSALVLDYVARQKLGGTHLTVEILKQLPVLPPSHYTPADIAFLGPRALELIYSSRSIAPLARDLGYKGQPFRWDTQRRASIRAELDAYFAYLYGLTKLELEYILDPKSVMGEDYPSETFRVLKENDLRQFNEYRTQRLVLEAWDRFVADGTFDPAKLREPQYIDRIADELSTTRQKLRKTESDYNILMALAAETPRPTLFVEGMTDARIIEAAWSLFFPKEALPVKLQSAGGTTQMGSLAGKGKALREVLGDRMVLALADNDAEGRKLVEDGHIRKGGLFKQLPNGIHWCLLKPTDKFATAMKQLNIPASNWPFTIEAAFSPGLRRQAEAAEAYSFSGKPQAELLDNAEVANRLFPVLNKLTPNDDAYFWLMAPAPESKEAFATWVTQPERRTEANYAAFEEIIRSLRDLLARRGNGGSDISDPKRGAA